MTQRTAYLGYDPGGLRNNGGAILFVDDGLPCGAIVTSVDGVDELIDWFGQELGEVRPLGVGIDAPLTWSGSASGWRAVDWALRVAFPLVKQSVFSTNSAYGAVAVQGPLLAGKLRERHPEIEVNETHPKVLYHALAGTTYDFGPAMVHWLQDRSLPNGPPIHIENDHEWDALISAWATFSASIEDETTWIDLLELPGGSELYRPAGKVRYWWPRETLPAHKNG